MYDMTKIKSKSWEVMFIDGRKLNILPLKMNIRHEVLELLQDTENVLKSMAIAISKIASNNKEQINISTEEVESLMDEEQMSDFVNEYTSWLTGETNNPN